MVERLSGEATSSCTPSLEITKNPQAGKLSSAQPERKRHHEAVVSEVLPEPSPKRTRHSLAERRENATKDQASTPIDLQTYRVLHWSEQGTWPPETEERAMQNFREDHPPNALARRRSSTLGYKRSSGSLVTETTTSGDKKALPEKISYKDEQVRIELNNIGSFMDDHKEGITPESRALCQELLNNPQQISEDVLFSDELFPEVCKMVKGQNEATVVRHILPRLVPSPKIRALLGADHLKFLNETVNASWINATKCCSYRPHPDYSIGIHREAFSREQLQKLQPFIGTRLSEESLYTATYDTCFPFLTTEVKCGAIALDVADRQNAVSQTCALRGLVTLFRIVGREQELHRKVLGFSISHDNEAVRIYGHYPFIDGKITTYHRCVISEFNITPTIEGDKRWKTAKFVQNVQDKHAIDLFKMLCSAVDMLRPEAESRQWSRPSSQLEHFSQASEPERSGLSQQLETSEIADEPQTSAQPITPDASTRSVGRKKKRTTGASKS